MSPRLGLPLLAVAILLVVALLFAGLAPSYPYTYDESDYMWAGTRGFRANYLDENSLSFPTFVEKGLELMRTPGKRSSFSEYIRSTGDLGMYRHFHGPVYAYWLALGQALGFSHPGQFRGSGIAIHLVTTLTSMLVFWWLFPTLPRWTALLVGLLTGLNRTALVTAMTISQHLVFILVSLLALALAGRFLRDFNPRWFYALMALLAVAFATVESAAFLTVGILISLLLARAELLTRFGGWRGLLLLGAQGLFVWAVALLVVWPAGLLSLNVLKGYLAMGYLAIARSGFTTLTFAGLWQAKFVASPWEFGAFLAALPLLWLCRRHLPRESWPFLCYALTAFLVTIKMTTPFTHYLGSLVLACIVSLGVAVGSFSLARPRLGPLRTAPLLGALFALSALLMAYGYRPEVIRSQSDYSHLDPIISHLRQAPAGQRWFVPFLLVPTLHFYHPRLRFTAYDTDWAPGRLAGDLNLAPLPAGLLGDPATCLQIRGQLGPQRFSDPQSVALPSSNLAQPLTSVLLLRSNP